MEGFLGAVVVGLLLGFFGFIFAVLAFCSRLGLDILTELRYIRNTSSTTNNYTRQSLEELKCIHAVLEPQYYKTLGVPKYHGEVEHG